MNKTNLAILLIILLTRVCFGFSQELYKEYPILKYSDIQGLDYTVIFSGDDDDFILIDLDGEIVRVVE